MLRGLLRQRLVQQWRSDRHAQDAAVPGRRDPSEDPTARSLLLSTTGLPYCSMTEHCKLFLRNLPPFPSRTPLLCLLKGGFLISHVGEERGSRPNAATWEPAATQDARAAVSSATKITSRLSAYFRTLPSRRATRPNYSRLLLYLLWTLPACAQHTVHSLVRACPVPRCTPSSHLAVCPTPADGKVPATPTLENPLPRLLGAHWQVTVALNGQRCSPGRAEMVPAVLQCGVAVLCSCSIPCWRHVLLVREPF